VQDDTEEGIAFQARAESEAPAWNWTPGRESSSCSGRSPRRKS